MALYSENDVPQFIHGNRKHNSRYKNPKKEATGKILISSGTSEHY